MARKFITIEYKTYLVFKQHIKLVRIVVTCFALEKFIPHLLSADWKSGYSTPLSEIPKKLLFRIERTHFFLILTGKCEDYFLISFYL